MRIITFVMFYQNSTKTYAKLHIWGVITLKLVHNFTQNHTFAKFFQTVQKPLQNHTLSVHSQKCNIFYANPHICDIISKQYKNQWKSTYIWCTLKLVHNFTVHTQSHICEILSNSTKTYAESHMFGALSKQYKILRKIIHLRYSFKTVQKPMQKSHLLCTLKSVQHFTENHTFAVHSQNTTNA